MVVSTENAEHYVWGQVCDGWHLVKYEEMSVIQERVPAGGEEATHFHNTARQFFYILEGEATMVFEEGEVILHKGEGLEVPPQVKHQFKNESKHAVHFLVVSVPSTRGDRLNV
jgi:mannose-6-phosphate isomerase-like protein (cupin superfamily)